MDIYLGIDIGGTKCTAALGSCGAGGEEPTIIDRATGPIETMTNSSTREPSSGTVWMKRDFNPSPTLSGFGPRFRHTTYNAGSAEIVG